MHIDESLPCPLTGIHWFLLIIAHSCFLWAYFTTLPLLGVRGREYSYMGSSQPFLRRTVDTRLEGAVLSAVTERNKEGETVSVGGKQVPWETMC